MSNKTPYNVIGITHDCESEFKNVARGKSGAASMAKRYMRENRDDYQMVIVEGEWKDEVGRAVVDRGEVVWKRNKRYRGA